MKEPERTLFTKLPDKTQDELLHIIKMLAMGHITGKIILHCHDSVVAETKVMVNRRNFKY